MVWTRYGGTAAKAGGKQRTPTSSCSLGSLQPTRTAPRSYAVQKLPYGDFVECRATLDVVKADVSWEETGIGTRRTTGVWVQASGERFAEITLGKTSFQQGRAATCKDSRYKGRTEVLRGFRSGA